MPAVREVTMRAVKRESLPRWFTLTVQALALLAPIVLLVLALLGHEWAWWALGTGLVIEAAAAYGRWRVRRVERAFAQSR
jgi:Na+-driven multidrug efflux pump